MAKEQNRILEKYKTEVVPALIKEFGYKNVNEVPKLEKIVLNMGLGEVKGNSKSFNIAVDELAVISGQKPVVTVAKKSISNFGLREGQKIGANTFYKYADAFGFFDQTGIETAEESTSPIFWNVNNHFIYWFALNAVNVFIQNSWTANLEFVTISTHVFNKNTKVHFTTSAHFELVGRVAIANL